ncbi:hypothetical protein RvY_11337 [Ramazzottius varieornatus]|uniref:OTU domain-containing protein n=1 Tax=Ramazzottius varieornatus TaxID=947166 RepID=A0A1D1VL85_RAMVA|nr:hypothetical protein RvY_11337 [Ramazzottius varieornatus]
MAKKKGGGGGKHKGKAQKSSSSTRDKNSSSTDSTPATEPSRRQPARACKKKSKANTGFDYEEYFAAFGLKIRKMMGDGNCLFRAFADQVEGSETNHSFYRTKVVQHVADHKDEYAIFHEQEEEKTFDERLKKLKKNGTFGGQESLVAFARVFKRVVFVHQPDEKITLQLPPCQDVDPSRFKQVHILYTGGNHYDSIRFDEQNEAIKRPANVLLLSDPNKEQIQYVQDTRKLEDIPLTSSSPLSEGPDDDKDSGVDSESLDGSTDPSSRLSEPSENEGSFEKDQSLLPDGEVDSTVTPDLPLIASVEDTSGETKPEEDVSIEKTVFSAALSEPSAVLSSGPAEVTSEAPQEESKAVKNKNNPISPKEKALSKKEKRARKKNEKVQSQIQKPEVLDISVVERGMAAMRMVTV